MAYYTHSFNRGVAMNSGLEVRFQPLRLCGANWEVPLGSEVVKMYTSNTTVKVCCRTLWPGKTVSFLTFVEGTHWKVSQLAEALRKGFLNLHEENLSSFENPFPQKEDYTAFELRSPEEIIDTNPDGTPYKCSTVRGKLEFAIQGPERGQIAGWFRGASQILASEADRIDSSQGKFLNEGEVRRIVVAIASTVPPIFQAMMPEELRAEIEAYQKVYSTPSVDDQKE